MTITRRRYFSISLGTALATTVFFVVLSACTDGQAKTGKPNFVFKDSPGPGCTPDS